MRPVRGVLCSKAKIRALGKKERSVVWDCREIRVGKNSEKAFEFSKKEVPNFVYNSSDRGHI